MAWHGVAREGAKKKVLVEMENNLEFGTAPECIEDAVGCREA